VQRGLVPKKKEKTQMARLFKKHPLTVFRATKSGQHTFFENERSYDLLRQVRFRDIDETSDRSLSVGAVMIENYRSTNFGPGNVEFGEYIAFSVRVDERKAPAAAVKKAFDDAVERELELAKAQGKNFVSRARKLEIKEQVKLRITAQMPPVPKVVDVFWNTRSGLLFVTDKSPKMIERVSRVLDNAFSPEFVFERVEMESGLDAMPGVLDCVWEGRNVGGFQTVYNGQLYRATVEDKIVISDRYEEIRGSGYEDGAPLDEIAEGIKKGKNVARALIRFEGETNGFSFEAELSTSSLPNMLSLSIPTVTHHDEEEFAGALMEQMGNVEEAFGVVCAMMEQLP
jgi:uncharacterized protein (DUF4415 family)